MTNRSTGHGRKRGSFARVPTNLLLSDLGAHAIAVWAALAVHDKKDDAIVFPTLTTISNLAGISINPVRAAIRVLAATGWVTPRQRSKKGSVTSTEYRLDYGHATVSPGDMVETETAAENGPTVSPGDMATVSLSGGPPYHQVTQKYKKEIEEGKQTRSVAAQATPSPQNGLDVGNSANTPACFADGIPFAMPYSYDDGTLYADVFWWAECYLPELFAETPTQRDFALYATWTREEYEDFVIQAVYQCSIDAGGIPYHQHQHADPKLITPKIKPLSEQETEKCS